jgi:DNA-binding transcriptional LysR family regulator
MELRQLQYVLAAAEEGSFTRAAQRVHIAQPAISQQIAQLERELGATLFDRSGRRIRLTSAGEAFLVHARAAVRATAAARDAVLAQRGQLSGQLTVGTIPSPPGWLLQQLRRYRELYPQVGLTLRLGSPEPLAAHVAAGTLDAALIGVSGHRQPAGSSGQRLRAVVAAAAVATEPLVIAITRDHRLALTDEVDLAELRDEPMVALSPGTGLRAVLENACSEAGFTPRIRCETDQLPILADLVAHGFGIALMPQSTAERAHLPNVPLRTPALDRPMFLIWHRHQLSAPTRALLDVTGAQDEASKADATD